MAAVRDVRNSASASLRATFDSSTARTRLRYAMLLHRAPTGSL